MLNDKLRNQFYYDALNTHAAGKVVLDMGSGTGILSFYALAAGAKFVYAVERDSDAAALTYEVLKQQFDTSKFAVLNCDFWTDELNPGLLQHSIDILVSETVGPGLFDQGMMHTWHCLKPYLSPDAISIPDTLSCDLRVWQDPECVASLQHPSLIETNVCLNQEFVKALLSQNTPSYKKMQWVNVDSILFEPDHIYTDKVAYTMDCLPDLNFSSDPYPAHIKPDISFSFETNAPAFVAVMNKISFESETLYTKFTGPTSPAFYISTAGKYRMTYINVDLSHLPDEEWELS